MYGVENTYGYLTKHTRITHGLPKTHCVDAYCIAGNLKAVRRGVYLHQRQMRKHNRQIHKFTVLSKRLEDGTKIGYRKLNQSPYLVHGRGVYLHQRQMRKHNRQIHKFTVLSKRLEDGTKIGYRKLNQSPYLVHDFRLFDKVRCLGQIGFIFGRRSSGYFDVRRLDGVKLSPSISWRKLTLLFRLFDKVRCLGQIGFIFGRRSSGYFDVRRLDGVKLSPSISWRKLTLLEKRSTYLTELRKQDGASSPV